MSSPQAKGSFGAADLKDETHAKPELFEDKAVQTSNFQVHANEVVGGQFDILQPAARPARKNASKGVHPFLHPSQASKYPAANYKATVKTLKAAGWEAPRLDVSEEQHSSPRSKLAGELHNGKGHAVEKESKPKEKDGAPAELEGAKGSETAEVDEDEDGYVLVGKRKSDQLSPSEAAGDPGSDSPEALAVRAECRARIQSFRAKLLKLHYDKMKGGPPDRKLLHEFVTEVHDYRQRAEELRRDGG